MRETNDRNEFWCRLAVVMGLAMLCLASYWVSAGWGSEHLRAEKEAAALLMSEMPFLEPVLTWIDVDGVERWFVHWVAGLEQERQMIAQTPGLGHLGAAFYWVLIRCLAGAAWLILIACVRMQLFTVVLVIMMPAVLLMLFIGIRAKKIRQMGFGAGATPFEQRLLWKAAVGFAVLIAACVLVPGLSIDQVAVLCALWTGLLGGVAARVQRE